MLAASIMLIFLQVLNESAIGRPAGDGLRRSDRSRILALLCGEQGAVSDKIFDLVADQPAAESTFAAAWLGEDPREFVRTRNPEQLSENNASQILTVTSALATHACIADLLTEETAVTGYKVAKMAAWSIAGIWTADEALRLTNIRARLMEAQRGRTAAWVTSAGVTWIRSNLSLQSTAARSRSGIRTFFS